MKCFYLILKANRLKYSLKGLVIIYCYYLIIVFREQIRNAVKIRAEYGPVVRATLEAKRRKQAAQISGTMSLPQPMPTPVVDPKTGAVTMPSKGTFWCI